MAAAQPDPDEPAWEDRRLAFGSWAHEYDRWRPDYPTDALRWMLQPAGDPPLRVVDLGAGTGRLARIVSGLGHDVIAVEPDGGMRAIADRVMPGATREGTAEDIPVTDGSVDAVVAGQAYHWFEPDRALPEIARVLRVGGVLAVVWNIRDDRGGWVGELSGFAGGVDRTRHRPRDVDFGPPFSPVEQAEFAHVQRLDADGLVGLVSSWSYVALRPDRDETLARVRHLAATHPDLAGREEFDLPYVTRAHRAVRT